MMPENWTVELLDAVTENFDSLRLPVKGADRVPGPYPYYGASGIVDYVDKYIFDGEYLLIAEDGENLRSLKTPIAFLARGKFWVNNHAHIVKSNNRADTRFLLYALLNADISGYLTGSTMPKLTQGNMNRIPMLMPPVSEQIAIADILGTLDAKIELNRRTNETLEAIARALFKSWFVDFDPVRAKAEGRQPVGMDAETTAVFPNTFLDSPLGLIPAGWRASSLDAVTTICRETISPGDHADEIFDYYSLPAFDQGRVSLQEAGKWIKSIKFLVPAGAVLLSRLNPHIPRVWLPRIGSMRRSISSTEFLVCLPNSGYPREYLYCLFGSEPFLETFRSLVTGTSGSHQRVKADYFPSMPALAPTHEVMSRFVDNTRPALERVAQNIEESRTLAALRDALLPRLMSGEIRFQ